MTDFLALLSNPKQLSAALESVQLSDKHKEDLIQLYGTRGGVVARRDAGKRLRGDTVYTCSKVGSFLTTYFDGIGPNDKMMWIGLIKRDAKGEERWVMRPEVKLALQALKWV